MPNRLIKLQMHDTPQTLSSPPLTTQWAIYWGEGVALIGTLVFLCYFISQTCIVTLWKWWWRAGAWEPPHKHKINAKNVSARRCLLWRKIWGKLVCATASSQTSCLNCNFPTLCQWLDLFCTQTWSLISISCSVHMAGPQRDHWVTLGQQSNTWE